jgi:hypothetical protein
MTVKDLIEREIVMPGLDPAIHDAARTVRISGRWYESPALLPGRSTTAALSAA